MTPIPWLRMVSLLLAVSEERLQAADRLRVGTRAEAKRLYAVAERLSALVRSRR